MEQRPAVKTPPQNRFSNVDTVKGIAIILMVYGHTQQGGTHRHLWDAMPQVSRFTTFADAFIYSFHMAAFFFVAGLFLAGSAQRRGAYGFALEKIRTVLYPYVLLVLIGTLSGPLTAGFRSAAQPFSWHSMFLGLVTGNSSWFLITLFICQMLALLVLMLPHWAQMALALTASVVVPVSGIVVLYTPFFYFPFVVAGMWFSGARLPMLQRIPRTFAWMGFFILLPVQLTTIYLLGPVTRWDRVPVGLVGIAMLLLLSEAMPVRILKWYGEASLGIFVLSSYFQGLGREFVTRALHTTHPLPYLGITTLVATTVPALIWYAQDRLRVAWLFRWPTAKKKAMQPVAG